jgi:ABC-2 type transport system ATP-binding protein
VWEIATVDDHAMSIRGLRKSYGTTKAVDGLDLDVMRAEVFALLGPNGADVRTFRWKSRRDG